MAARAKLLLKYIYYVFQFLLKYKYLLFILKCTNHVNVAEWVLPIVLLATRTINTRGFALELNTAIMFSNKYKKNTDKFREFFVVCMVFCLDFMTLKSRPKWLNARYKSSLSRFEKQYYCQPNWSQVIGILNLSP